MKNLTKWVNANKISLNVKKAIVVIFKHKNQKSKIKPRLYPSKSVKYLGVKNENQHWTHKTIDNAKKIEQSTNSKLKIITLQEKALRITKKLTQEQ